MRRELISLSLMKNFTPPPQTNACFRMQGGPRRLPRHWPGLGLILLLATAISLSARPWRPSTVLLRSRGSKGFGSALIERSLPHDLGGSVSLQYLPEGVHADFAIPLTPAAAAIDRSDPDRPPAAGSPVA